MKRTLALAMATAAAVAPAVALAPSAVAENADSRTLRMHADLSPVPYSKVTGSGTATVSLTGHEATVTVQAQDLLAGAPHAQHFHIEAKGVCPPASAAKERNGILSINTTDGAPFYGGIGTSLTTTGDTSPDSGLAVDRFPTGPAIDYHRTLTLSPEAAESVRAGTAVVVVHGVDVNGNGEYDDVLGESDLDPALPAEATNPALCGSLAASPRGAVAGGLGGSQTDAAPTTAAAAAGGGLLAAALGTVLLRRRLGRQS